MSEDQVPISVRGLGRSVATYRFGGREYPMKTVARCLTCMSPFRFEIEEAIVAGRIYKRIADQIAGYGDEYAVSVRSIQDHYNNGHMPLELTNTRQIIEARARKVGKAVDESHEQLVDGITLMETVVLKAFEGIAKGTVEVDARAGLRAAKMLADLGEYDGSSVDQQSYVEAFMAYHETAEELMGPEAFAEFGRKLAQNPVLQALASRYDGDDPEEHDVVRGEVESQPDGDA